MWFLHRCLNLPHSAGEWKWEPDAESRSWAECGQSFCRLEQKTSSCQLPSTFSHRFSCVVVNSCYRNSRTDLQSLSQASDQTVALLVSEAYRCSSHCIRVWEDKSKSRKNTLLLWSPDLALLPQVQLFYLAVCLSSNCDCASLQTSFGAMYKRTRAARCCETKNAEFEQSWCERDEARLAACCIKV